MVATLSNTDLELTTARQYILARVEIIAECRWQIGRKLSEVKARYPGRWLTFVAELPFSHDTAGRYMTIARELPEPETALAQQMTLTGLLEMTRAPETVQLYCLDHGVRSPAAVKLLAWSQQYEPELYREIVTTGHLQGAEMVIPIATAQPAQVREFMSERRLLVRPEFYSVTGRVMSDGGRRYIEIGAGLPDEFNGKSVSMRIRAGDDNQ